MNPPRFLRCLGKTLPPALPSLPFVSGLEIARHLGWLSPPPEIDDRRFTLHVTDLGLHLGFRCMGGRFRPVFAGVGGELELAATAADFFDLLRGRVDADTLFFRRKLKIRGDTELGLVVKNWLDAAERPAWFHLSTTEQANGQG